LVAIGGLLLVFSRSASMVNANRNWWRSVVTVQPAEAAKLALVVWAAACLARKQRCAAPDGHVLVPVVIPARWCCSGSCWRSATSAPGSCLMAADDRAAVLRRRRSGCSC
jgi:hypothetical protein